jgi:hypothetical protein
MKWNTGLPEATTRETSILQSILFVSSDAHRFDASGIWIFSGGRLPSVGSRLSRPEALADKTTPARDPESLCMNSFAGKRGLNADLC